MIMKEKLSCKITARFTEEEMNWLQLQAEQVGVETSNIIRISVRKMKLEGGVIHISPAKETTVSTEKASTKLIEKS